MSKPSKRISHDWPALIEEMRDAGPEWEQHYVHALQRSLEGRKHDALLALLDAKAPLHPHLLPILADVLRSVYGPLVTGRGSELTAHQDKVVRGIFNSLTADKRKEIGRAHDWIAEQLDTSVDTVKRSLIRTQAKKSRAN